LDPSKVDIEDTNNKEIKSTIISSKSVKDYANLKKIIEQTKELFGNLKKLKNDLFRQEEIISEMNVYSKRLDNIKIKKVYLSESEESSDYIDHESEDSTDEEIPSKNLNPRSSDQDDYATSSYKSSEESDSSN
jgi:predicted nuclease with TOPRIM domain